MEVYKKRWLADRSFVEKAGGASNPNFQNQKPPKNQEYKILSTNPKSKI